MLNLSVLLEDSARKYPTRDALVLGDTRLTYAQVDGAANQVANLLVSRGIQPGDKVALSCPNLPFFPIVYYGILKAGAVVVPLNVLLKAREIAYHLGDSDAKAYFCFQGTADLPMGTDGYAGFEQADGCEHFFMVMADPAAPSHVDGTETLGQALKDQSPVFESVQTAETDTAVILYTSGTTGQPKGAELSHSNLMMNALTCNRLFGTTPTGRAAPAQSAAVPLVRVDGPDERRVLHRIHARAAAPLRRGAGRRPCCRRRTSRFFAGVPTMWWGLLGALTDDVDVDQIASNLRVAVSGGSSLPVEIIKQVQGTLPRPDPRGLRTLRDQPRSHLQRPRPGPPSRLHRCADLGCRGEARRRELEDGGRHRRGRRDRHPRTQHHARATTTGPRRPPR